MLKEVLKVEQGTEGKGGLPSTPGPAHAQVKSAARVLDILEYLARSERESTLTEIATTLGLPKSSTWLLLQTLTARGYLDSASPSGPFALGSKVMALAGAYTRKATLLQSFPAVAGALVDACGETVQLAALTGIEVLYLAKQDGTRPVRLVSDTGKRIPAHAPALGKILLAALSDRELEERFCSCSFPKLTSNTIASLPQLKQELAMVRSRGYAIDNEEVVDGLLCFAAPVRDASGKVVAGMSVSVPKNRVVDGDADHFVALIRQAAQELSRRIGHVDPPLG